MFVLWPDDIDVDAPIGGKAKALLALARAELPVPDWFVVSAVGFEASLLDGARDAIGRGASPEVLREGLRELAPVGVLRRELRAALARLCPGAERSR